MHSTPQLQEGYENWTIVAQKSRYVLETARDREGGGIATVAMANYSEILCLMSKHVLIDDAVWPLKVISDICKLLIGKVNKYTAYGA